MPQVNRNTQQQQTGGATTQVAQTPRPQQQQRRRQAQRRQGQNRRNRGRFVRQMPSNTGGIEEKVTLTTRESNIIWQANAEALRSDCANLQLRLAGVMKSADYASLEDVIHNDLLKLKQQAQAQIDSIAQQTKGKKLPAISFDGAREITVARNSPLFKEFVEGVRLLDKLFTVIEALWLDGSFSSAKRSELIQNWMSAYSDMGRKIQQLVGQAINQAAREREERRRERQKREEERAQRRAERRAQQRQISESGSTETKPEETGETAEGKAEGETTEEAKEEAPETTKAE